MNSFGNVAYWQSVVIFCFLFSCQSSVMSGSPNQAFSDSGLTEDLLLSDGPGNALTIKYGNEAVNFGNTLAVSTASRAPTLIQWSADPNSFYSLIMTDPDAPSRQNPGRREWRHWVVVNILGNSVEKGDVLTPYNGPAPPKGTGPHRYGFLLFKQSGKINSTPLTSERGGWKANEFAAKNDLELFAGNYFLAENR